MEYIENAHAAEQPDSEQCQKIAGAVSDIHGRSYLHGDPYIHNFLFDTSGGLVLIDALLKPRQFWLTSKLQEWFHLDWGARKLAGNAISQKKEQLIEQSPIRFGIFRMLNWLKAMRSNAFRAKSGQ
jgi:tRNA A-37 threonylcarbamoyl transferase component Bud32